MAARCTRAVSVVHKGQGEGEGQGEGDELNDACVCGRNMLQWSYATMETILRTPPRDDVVIVVGTNGTRLATCSPNSATGSDTCSDTVCDSGDTDALCARHPRVWTGSGFRV